MGRELPDRKKGRRLGTHEVINMFNGCRQRNIRIRSIDQKKFIKLLVDYETDPLYTYGVNVMCRAIADYGKLAVKINSILEVGYSSASKWKM